MEDPKVKELAQMLKNSGLAVSDYEAMEKAKAIMGVDIREKEQLKEPVKIEVPEAKEEFFEKEEAKKEGFFSHLKEKFHHEKPQADKHRFSQPEYDVSQEDITVNDLMRELGVNPEEIPESREKIEEVEEKISELREELFKEEKEPEEEKVEEIKQKIEDIKEEIEEIEKEKAESRQERH